MQRHLTAAAAVQLPADMVDTLLGALHDVDVGEGVSVDPGRCGCGDHALLHLSFEQRDVAAGVHGLRGAVTVGPAGDDATLHFIGGYLAEVGSGFGRGAQLHREARAVVEAALRRISALVLVRSSQGE